MAVRNVAYLLHDVLNRLNKNSKCFHRRCRWYRHRKNVLGSVRLLVKPSMRNKTR